MNKSVWKIAKLNIKNINAAYFTGGIIALLLLGQTIVKVLAAIGGSDMSDQLEISGGPALYLIPLLAAIIIPAKNFQRIVNLGGKRGNFFLGSFLSYVLLSCAVSLVNVIIHYTFDRAVKTGGYFGPEVFGGIINLVEVYGWTSHGAIAAFLRQFAFLLLLSVFTHTLTAIQDKWYGWVTDIVLVAVISVFTPIAPLRQALVWFFNLIIFTPNAFLQILSCLVLALALYALNKPILARKAI